MAGEEGEQGAGARTSVRCRRIRSRARRVLAGDGGDEELEDEETGGVWGVYFGIVWFEVVKRRVEGALFRERKRVRILVVFKFVVWTNEAYDAIFAGIDRVQRELLARAAKKAAAEKEAREEQLQRSRQEQGEKRKGKDTAADASPAKRVMGRASGSTGMVSRPSAVVVAPPSSSGGSPAETSRVAALGDAAGTAGSAGVIRAGSRQSGAGRSSAFPV